MELLEMLKSQLAEMDEVLGQQKVKITSLNEDCERSEKLMGL